MELEALKHQFCLFYKDSHLVAGWIKETQKNKLVVLPLQGREVVLPANRLSLTWKNKLLTEATPALAYLREQMNAAEALVDQHELSLMHELTEAGRAYTLEELAQAFLETPADSTQRVALFLALEKDRLFFKRKNETYLPRTSEELELFRKQQEREQQHQQWLAQVERWLEEMDSGRWTHETPLDEMRLQWIKQLQQLLVEGREAPQWKTLAPLLRLNESHPEDNDLRLRRWLQQIGQPVSWCRLILLRAKARYEFPPFVEEEAQRLAQSPAPHEERKDWREVFSFTIDAATTKDYDDALSVLSWSEEGAVVAVHIADLSTRIFPEMAVFEEAERRISSIYTLRQVFPMLPEVLSNELFSLKAGADRLSMSFVFDLAYDRLPIFQGVQLALIHVAKNFTYEEADAAIERGEAFWQVLADCSHTLRQQRLERGALEFQRAEVEIDLSNPEQIRIEAIDRQTPANEIIQEFAILVNQEAARYLKNNRCPAIYRTQAPYTILKEAKDGEELTLEHVQMEPARLSTDPLPHSSLGCECYLQVTSPIRRFGDLVMQAQLAHYLRQKQPLFAEEKLLGWAEQIETLQKNYGRAERDIQDHWKTKYLVQHQGEVFSARIRRHLPNFKSEVVLEAIQYSLHLPGLSRLAEGSLIHLRIEHIDLDRHLVMATMIQAS